MKILSILLFLVPTFSPAQKLVTGRVIDSETKKFIKEALVKIVNSTEEAKSNPYGYFQLIIDSTAQLIVSAQGYEVAELNAPRTNTFIVPLFRETMPGFQGGMQEFYRSIGQTVRYPAAARRVGIEGRVYVAFEVDSTLGIQSPVIIKDIGNECGKEVIRSLNLSPNSWIPKTKTVTLIIPVTFRLGGSKKEYPALGSEIGLPSGAKLLKEIVVSAMGSDPR